MNKFLSLMLFLLFATSSGLNAAPVKLNIEDTVVKIPLDEGVSFDDAVESMKLRANAHNMKLVAELLLSKQIKSMGSKSRRFAAYLPCRISLVEDEKGKGWLLMMNLDIMLQSATLGDVLKAKATKVRDVLTDIMKAGASGDL